MRRSICLVLVLLIIATFCTAFASDPDELFESIYRLVKNGVNPYTIWDKYSNYYSREEFDFIVQQVIMQIEAEDGSKHWFAIMGEDLGDTTLPLMKMLGLEVLVLTLLIRIINWDRKRRKQKNHLLSKIL